MLDNHKDVVADVDENDTPCESCGQALNMTASFDAAWALWTDAERRADAEFAKAKADQYERLWFREQRRVKAVEQQLREAHAGLEEIGRAALLRTPSTDQETP